MACKLPTAVKCYMKIKKKIVAKCQALSRNNSNANKEYFRERLSHFGRAARPVANLCRLTVQSSWQ